MSEKTPKGEHLINRRDALIWLGKGVAVTGYYAALNGVGAAIQTHEIDKKLQRQQEESRRALESNKALQVKYFATDIVDASVRITGDALVEDLVGMAAGCLTAVSIGGYSLRDYSNKINRIVGAVSNVTARTIDTVSTLAVTKYLSDPRMQAYGLGDFYYEANIFSPPHPSAKDVITLGAILGAATTPVSLVAPSFGRGYLGASPFLAISNYEVAHQLGTSLNLGDRVKTFIEQGRDQSAIKDYLHSIQPLPKKSVPNRREIFPFVK